MIAILLFIVVFGAMIGGALGHARYGYRGWLPAGAVVLAAYALWLTGHLRLY